MKEEIGFQIKEIHNLISRKAFRESRKYTNKGVSPIQGMIVKYIIDKTNNHEEVFQKDIQSTFRLRRSTLSGILQTMENNGLIKKESSKSDLRSKKIIITNDSNDLYDDIIEKLNNSESVMKNGISKNELDIFYKVSNKIIENLKENEQC